MKLYRRHNCGRRHRSYRTLAACIWKRAVMLGGEGPFASLAHCRGLSVMLHPTQAAAETAVRIIDHSGCGGGCCRRHEIVQLVEAGKAEPWGDSTLA
jgi:hypothetical protein